MKKMLFITMIIILTSSPAYPLVYYKVSPDYEIQASMITTDKGWKVNIKIRDMLQKKYIKAWSETTVAPEDIDLTGNRDLGAFNHEYGESFGCDIVGESIGTCNYKRAYKAITYSVFRIAMQIQDAGFIPIIRYGSIDQISTTGVMYHSTKIQPTGNSHNFRKIVTTTRYLPDYYIYAGISPVMSDDNLSVLSWITTFEVKEYISQRSHTIWTASETNLLNFDLTEPAANTKSKFIISSATWLDAQKAMFVQSHTLMTKMIKQNPAILLEIKFSPIEFTNSGNVKLIDLANGILPDGIMETSPVIPPLAIPIQISPAHAAEGQVRTGLALSWNPISGATRYYLQISKDGTEPGFAATALKYTLTGTSYTISTTLTAASYYYWRVRAENGDPDMTSGYSDARYFKTQ